MGSDNPRYADNAARCAAEAEILKAIGDWCAAHTLDAAVAAMAKARVPAGPILTTSALMAEPQMQARRMFAPASPPGGGRPAMLPAMLPVLSATPGATRWAGPELGQHTDEVLAEVGYSPSEVAALRAAGAI
jgi:crotonobetainyl-CoA:carnitine CoA-transferase CaiB-like acyl-CoA transferase